MPNQQTQPEITPEEIDKQLEFDRGFLEWLVDGPGPEPIQLNSRFDPTPCPCEYCSYKRYLKGKDAS